MGRAQWGDIWEVDFGDPLGHEQGSQRLGVVVSPNEMNDGPTEMVIIVPTTTTPRGIWSHVEIEPTIESNLDELTYAKCEDVRAVSDIRLVYQIGVAPFESMFEIRATLTALLGQ